MSASDISCRQVIFHIFMQVGNTLKYVTNFISEQHFLFERKSPMVLVYIISYIYIYIYIHRHRRPIPSKEAG